MAGLGVVDARGTTSGKEANEHVRPRSRLQVPETHDPGQSSRTDRGRHLADDLASVHSRSSWDSGTAERFLTVEEEEKQVEHLNWWCEQQLHRCLQKLRRYPEAAPFLEPVPWEELGLADYPEVIEDPMDLRTLGELLSDGQYYNDEGIIDPSSFWEDVNLCWENCLLYYEGEEDAEPCQMAEFMMEEAGQLEEEFWDDLDRFEKSIDDLAPGLGMAGAAVDVAGTALGDTMAFAYTDGKAAVASLASAVSTWWSTGKNGSGSKRLPLRAQHPDDIRTPLHEHFCELLEWEFGGDASKDLLDLQTSIVFRLRAAWPVADKAHDDEEEFTRAKELLPIEELVPSNPPPANVTSAPTRQARRMRARRRKDTALREEALDHREEESEASRAPSTVDETADDRSRTSSVGRQSSTGLVARRQIRRPAQRDTGSSLRSSPRGSETSIGSRGSTASRTSRSSRSGRSSRGGFQPSQHPERQLSASGKAMRPNKDGLFEF